MPLKFDLTLNAQPVDFGNGEEYVLLELTGTQRDAHMNDVNGRVKNGRITDFANLQCNLIAKALRKVVPEGEKGAAPVTVLYEGEDEPTTIHVRAVAVATIAAYPSRVQRALHDAARKMSGMEEEEEEGND